MNGSEGKRSREAVRNSIRAYGVKVMDPASLPLKKSTEMESQESMSRFSEKSLHSQYEIREGCCKGILNRIPYATLFATIVCLLGVLIVAIAEQRSAVLTHAMVNNVLRRNSDIIATFDLSFLVLEIVTGIVGIMVLIIGFLATGDTRAKIYSAWKSRIGGRLCCAFLMIVAFLLFFIWLAVFWAFTILSFLVIIWQIQCDINGRPQENKKCLNLPMLNIFFPGRKDDIEICENQEIKNFCKDFVEKSTLAYFATDIGTILIIISLVLYITCLAANYARIRCQAKFQELQELRHLEVDLHNSKDRF